jgi:hypothetical protein
VEIDLTRGHSNVVVHVACLLCRSASAIVTLQRPDTTWHFCPACNHHWYARPTSSAGSTKDADGRH